MMVLRMVAKASMSMSQTRVFVLRMPTLDQGPFQLLRLLAMAWWNATQMTQVVLGMRKDTARIAQARLVARSLALQRVRLCML